MYQWSNRESHSASEAAPLMAVQGLPYTIYALHRNSVTDLRRGHPDLQEIKENGRLFHEKPNYTGKQYKQ